MLANEKLPPFKWAIVYYNRFLFLATILGLLVYFLVGMANSGLPQLFLSYSLVATIAFLLKEVLYQSRGVIYSTGHTRFYILIILFYCPFLINAFIFNDFSPVNIPFDTSMIQHEFKEFVYYKLLIFSPSIAVIWYIFDIEFDKPSRKEMDIKSLLIADKKLHSWDNRLVIIANIFSIITISLYSIPLAIIIITILFFRTFIINNNITKAITLACGIICIFFAMGIKLQVLNLAHGWWSYWLMHGFRGMVTRQLYSFKGAVAQGVSAIAAPFFLLLALAEIRISKSDLRNIELHAKESNKEKEIEYGTEIGVNAITSKPVFITDEEFNSHALYLGTTGGGKTVAILTNIEYCAINGIPCVMLDGKGSPDLPEKIKYLADKYGRTFKLFTVKPETLTATLKENLAAYNMFSTGTHTEWKNRLMSLFAEAEGRGQQHYALQEEHVLNLIVNIVKNAGVKIDLKLLLQYIQSIDLLKELANITGNHEFIREVGLLDEDSMGDIGLILKLFINSSYGFLFDTMASNNIIELQESIINNEIILFLFDSSAYKEDTKKIAKMVINDINSAFSTIKERTGAEKKCFCIFDEFASYASNNLSDTLSLHRSNGVHAIVGTQSIETVSVAGSDTARVAGELIGNCGTYLILQLQHNDDIERIAHILGTKKGYEVTRQIDLSEGGGATGMGSTKVIDEFIIHPQMIRELNGKDGTGVIYRKSNGQKPFQIVLRRVEIETKQ